MYCSQDCVEGIVASVVVEYSSLQIPIEDEESQPTMNIFYIKLVMYY